MLLPLKIDRDINFLLFFWFFPLFIMEVSKERNEELIMKRKLLSMMLVTALSLGLITGCGSDGAGAEAENGSGEASGDEDEAEAAEDAGTEEAEAGSAQETESGDAQTITMMGWYDEPDMEPIIAEVNKQLGGKYVMEYTYVDNTNFNNVLSTQLAAGEGPDIIMDGSNFPAEIKAGNVEDISSYDFISEFNEA